MHRNGTKSVQQWLDHIGAVHPQSIELGLERVKKVAKKLNLFPFKPYAIIVAGTNGKGSTVGLLEQILTQSGYQVGAMTSPHLLRFNERIRLNTNECTDQEICEAFSIIEQTREDITLSYFEFVTLAGLWIFKQQKVDIALLEVGLGGRLDAVNIIDADLAVITNIDLDHQEYLGNTRELIGFEKAGILRFGIALVYGDLDIPHSVLKFANQLNVTIYQRGKDFDYQQQEHNYYFNAPELSRSINLTNAKIPKENVANVLQILTVMQPQFPINPSIIQPCVEHFTLAGRWQVVEGKFQHIYDVAHNPHGMQKLKVFLEQSPCKGKSYALFSMLNTKDILACLEVMQGIFSAWFVAPNSSSLSLTLQEFQSAFANYKNIQAKFYLTLETAYNDVLQQLKPNDRLVVFGSFYTVADIQALQV